MPIEFQGLIYLQGIRETDKYLLHLSDPNNYWSQQWQNYNLENKTKQHVQVRFDL